MPRYCFLCKCGEKVEVVRYMADADKSWRCLCGKEMNRDFGSEGVNSGNKEYGKPIHSDSLAISPKQRKEHEKLFPDVKLDSQCRPVLENYQQHDKYLKQIGFVKQPQKKKRKGVEIA